MIIFARFVITSRRIGITDRALIISESASNNYVGTERTDVPGSLLIYGNISLLRLHCSVYLEREIYVERGGSMLECRTRNRESPGSNPFATVSKLGHIRSLHDAPVHSAA